MGKQPAFQFYPGDWQRDLSEHPLEIEGAWIRICCALWWSETPGSSTKPLTNWARILRVGEKKSLSIMTYLLNQNIADVVIQNQNITISSRRMVKDEYIRNIRRNAGIRGGNPNIIRKQNEGDLLNQNLVNQNPTPSSSSSTSNTITPLTPRKRGDEYDHDFLIFWNAYPKKANKPAAYREWRKLGSKRPKVEVILSCIARQKSWRQWVEGFIPYPERWLKNERWLDEETQNTGGNGNGNGRQRGTRGPWIQQREADPLPEYKGEDVPAVSDEERKANLERIRAITGGVVAHTVT